MIDTKSDYVKGYLEHLRARVALTSEALSWVEGEPTLDPKELVPPFTEKSEAALAFERYAKQSQSLGPRALRIRRQGMIGSITWSKVPPRVNDLLDALPLRRLARDLAKDVLTNGIAALWPYVRARPGAAEGDGGAPTIQRIAGHLELLWNEDDVGGEPAGLLQVVGNAATYRGKGVRYDVRIWDFEDRQLRVWKELDAPGNLAEPPDETYPRAGETLEMPAVGWAELSQDGYPLGELKTALPLLKQEIGQAIRVLRTSDAHGYPIFTLAGGFETPSRLGANVVLRAKDASARAERVAPADLGPLFEEADRVQDRLRTDLLLPITTGGQIPSGEALVQANASYNNASDDGARLLSDLETAGARGYLRLLGIEVDAAFRVTVKPDRELKRMSIAMQVREDFRAGIINREIALGELEQFYPNLDTETLEDWLAEAAAPLPGSGVPSPGAFARSSGE